MRFKIIDLSAGNRAIWFNKNHPLALYLDKRADVHPDIVCDTRKGIPGSGYNLICWDPPHMNCGPNSNRSNWQNFWRENMTTSEVLFILYICVSSVILVHLLIESITWRGRAQRLKELLQQTSAEEINLRYIVNKQAEALRAQNDFHEGN
ncbi:MAG TPA: hypothetical protein PKW79_00325 [Rhabdochlamydiaceae bacterium]|nr:hypothetical protein [Rhabdochlamydiaceae bacterium]